MSTPLMGSEIAGMAVTIACCLFVLQRFTSDRWKRRFEAIGSPLIEPLAYRTLFLLVVIGMLLIATLPEAAFVLPALDAAGLDIVTILVAIELRHYWASVARLLCIPRRIRDYFRVPAKAVSRRANILWLNPALWLYECAWLVIWLRTVLGTARMLPPTPGPHVPRPAG